MRPVYAQPGYTEDDVKAVIASSQFVFADCYMITPRYGDIIRLTTADKAVRVFPLEGPSEVSYLSPANLQISGIRMNLSVGTEVDEQDMSINYDQTTMAWGVPMGKAIRLGRLDGATISRDRFFASSWGNPTAWVGGTPLFRGSISSVDSLSRVGAILKVKSGLVLLSTPMPRDLYQPGCVHTLYDVGCGLNKDDFEVPGTTEVGSTAQVINWAGATPSMSLGMIYIDTPEGITLVRTIQRATETQLFLAYPLEFVPPPGTTFSAYPGCSRTYERCGEFSNQEHYKGFPFVPVAETAV